MNPKTAPTVASAHRLRSLFRWAGITATALSCSMAPPLTGAARGQDPASWPTVALPTGLDTFSVGQDMINNGTPMRVQGFVSRRSQADLLNWFRQHWPAPLVETTQGQQQVLGRGQGGYYITVQIEAAGRDSQGSRGLVAIADLQGMQQQRPRHESAQQAWLQRWPSGTRVLSQVSTHDDGRNATHRVMSNSQSLHGNRQTLIELMRQDGYLRALIPLYGGGRNSAELTQSLTRARCDMEQGDPECLTAPGVMMRLEVLNPTRESFEDFAKDDQLNQQFGSDTLAIPNTGLALRPDLNTVGSASGQSLADANLLKIRITHGYRPKVWLMAMFYKKYLQWLDKGDDEFHTALIDAGRLPIVSHATLLMQSEALMRGQADEGPYASNPGQGNQGQPKDPGDAAVNDRDPPRCFTMGCSVSIDDPTRPGGGDSGGGTDGSGNDFGGGSGGFCPVT